MKRKIILTLFTIILLTQAAFSITPEEENTVLKLKFFDVAVKERTEYELSGPISTMDAMSMNIKSIRYTNKYIEDYVYPVFSDLNYRIASLDNSIFELDLQDKAFIMEIGELRKQVREANGRSLIAILIAAIGALFF